MDEVYLSRLWLDPRDRGVQRDLADCHALHRRIMQAFPAAGGPDPRATFGVLYRPEIEQRGGQVLLLAQSAVRPEWARLDASGGYFAPGTRPDCKEISAAYAAIRPGAALRFRLRANPTKRLSARAADRGDRLAGKRVGLLSEEEQLAWMHRRANDAGAEILDVTARPDPAAGSRQTGWSGQGAASSDRRRLTFTAVAFDGVLRVEDADRFRAALRAGVGPAKAYGFGLLSIAPASG